MKVLLIEDDAQVASFVKKGFAHEGYELTVAADGRAGRSRQQPYFAARQQTTFHPYVEVVFELANGAHYHVPITLSAFGCSTYRGS